MVGTVTLHLQSPGLIPTIEPDWDVKMRDDFGEDLQDDVQLNKKLEAGNVILPGGAVAVCGAVTFRYVFLKMHVRLRSNVHFYVGSVV